MVISDQALALTLRIVPFSSVSCSIAIAGMTIETMPSQLVSTHKCSFPKNQNTCQHPRAPHRWGANHTLSDAAIKTPRALLVLDRKS